MEHIYKSIEIKNYILTFFPLPDLALELIINNLKLAVDLNGYTNNFLKIYIENNVKNKTDLNKYLHKKYGKRRSSLSLLKKYQLIHIIQYYNIDIPLKRYGNILLEYQNTNKIKIDIENNIIKINTNLSNIELKINTLILITIKDNIFLYIYIKKIKNNKIYDYIIIYQNDNIIKILSNNRVGINAYKFGILYSYFQIFKHNYENETSFEINKIVMLLTNNCINLNLHQFNTLNFLTQDDLNIINTKFIL
tara:strand:+ start:12382 stop:13131 length:750 start_codon:yes stop_codon:yes gene_type:complete